MSTLLLFEGEWRGAESLWAVLPSDPGRAVDLPAVEAVRLAKLGEGDPQGLAAALVPSRLERILRGGPRALARARHALAYGDKWARRGTLPAALGPLLGELRPEPARPCRVLDGEGRDLPLAAEGPLQGLPRPTLALWGQAGPEPAGWTLACLVEGQVALCPWMVAGEGAGVLDFDAGGHRRRIPADAWSGLPWPSLGPGEVLLLPPPRLRALPALPKGTPLRLRCGPLQMAWTLGVELVHPTAQ